MLPDSAWSVPSFGTFNSSTMIAKMIATTPSVKASGRQVLMPRLVWALA
jgi:hypothetical protein